MRDYDELPHGKPAQWSDADEAVPAEPTVEADEPKRRGRKPKVVVDDTPVAEEPAGVE